MKTTKKKKQYKPKKGEVVQVSNDGEWWYKRIFDFTAVSGNHLCLQPYEDDSHDSWKMLRKVKAFPRCAFCGSKSKNRNL